MKTSTATERALLSVFAANQLGIAKRVSGFLHKHRANVVWMFAICEQQGEQTIFRIDCCFAAAPHRMLAIHDAHLAMLADLRPRMTTIARRHSVSIVSLDQEGIIAEATAILTRHRCDIQMIKSNSYPAPMCGREMFEIDIAIDMPAALDVLELQDAFDRVSCQRVWHTVISEDSGGCGAEKITARQQQLVRDDEALRMIARN